MGDKDLTILDLEKRIQKLEIENAQIMGLCKALTESLCDVNKNMEILLNFNESKKKKGEI